MTGTLPPAAPDAAVRCYGCGRRYDALSVVETAKHTHHAGPARQRAPWWNRRARRARNAFDLGLALRVADSVDQCQRERDDAIRAAHALAGELARRDSRLARLIARR